MAHNFSEMSLQQHIEWTDYINQRLENIYKELCEYEDIVNSRVEDNDSINIYELLTTINNLHEAATNLRPTSDAVARKDKDLDEHINNLQRSLDILKLEINDNPTKSTKTSQSDHEEMEAD